LEPSDATVPFEEGVIWAYFSPERAAGAWAETLRRDPARAPEYLRRMLTDANTGPALRTSLKERAAGQIDLLLVWLAHSPAEEARPQLAALLAASREFTGWSPAQMAQLFEAWLRLGDRAELIRALEGNAAWQEAGWRQLARAYAEGKDFESACRTVHRFAAPPVLPKLPEISVANAMSGFARRPGDFIAGYQLFEAQFRSGSLRSALATLDQLSVLPGAPAYLFWLRAATHERLGEWAAAWRALEVPIR